MSTPTYDQTISLSNTGSIGITTGNPPRDWDNTAKEYKLFYNDACLNIVAGGGAYGNVNLTGTRKLGSIESGSAHIGEMLIDLIEVHILNTIGALVEFSKGGVVLGSMTLVNGVGSEYIPAAHLSIDLTLSYNPYVAP